MFCPVQACRGYEISHPYLHPYPQIFFVDIHGNIHGYIHGWIYPWTTYSLSMAYIKIATTILQSTTGGRASYQKTMTQAFLCEIVIKMHKSK